MYLSTQYICLTPLGVHYLARVFHVVQQQLRDYTRALPELLSYVTMALTSVVYVEPLPNASKHIDYPRLYEEELIAFM